MSRRQQRSITVLLAAALVIALLGVTPLAATPPQWTNYWIVAHPDDEILEMGGALADHMLAGYNNVVVFVTDGEGTAARSLINDRYGLSMTPADIGDARIREARAALGVIGTYDIIRWHMVDGSVDTTEVERKIDALVGGVPYTQVKTHSPYESTAVNVDHQAIADAAQRLWEAGRLTNVRYYRVNQLIGRPVDGASWCTYLNEIEQAYKQAARAEYSMVDHAIGRYGVAEVSVSNVWVATETEPECVDIPRLGGS